MEAKKINILNKIFTRSVFRQIIEGSKTNIYSATVNQYVDEAEIKTNRELITEIYAEIKKNYRNEYFYKNTLLNKLLLGVHSVNTSTALTELPIANSKADLVIINGKAIVYEIKTELDNLDRLETQLSDYYKAFDNVIVVTYEKNLESVERLIKKYDKPVGICILRKNGKLGIIKKAESYTDTLDIETVFKLLRKGEYEEILEEKYGYLPNVTQFEYYSVCKKMFCKIPIEEVYECFLKKLKKRTKLEKDEFYKIPYELKFLAYFMELKPEDYRRLQMFLERKFGGV